MRILRVIPSLSAIRGGPSVAARGMSRALAGVGAEVVQATTVARGTHPHGDGSPWRDDGVTYRFFPRTPGLPSGFHYSRPIARFLRESVGDFDVMHVEALFQYPTIVACRAARRAGVPYVLGPLGSLNSWSMRHRRWKKLPYYHLVDRRHLADAAAIHVNSQLEADALIDLGFRDKVRLIPLGVDLPARLPDRASRAGSFHIVFLSRLHAIKGLPLLLQAMAGVVRRGIDTRLSIAGAAGAGEQDYERTLRGLVAELGLQARVRFIGHVEGEGKDALLREADAFALTSFQESFGIAVAEAMAYALPVLITDCVGIERDVREAGAGYVVTTDANEVESALFALASDRARAIEMGRRGASMVAARYSWEETGRRLLALYEEVARRPAAEGAPMAAALAR